MMVTWYMTQDNRISRNTPTSLQIKHIDSDEAQGSCQQAANARVCFHPKGPSSRVAGFGKSMDCKSHAGASFAHMSLHSTPAKPKRIQVHGHTNEENHRLLVFPPDLGGAGVCYREKCFLELGGYSVVQTMPFLGVGLRTGFDQ